jgi:hypothetical protein
MAQKQINRQRRLARADVFRWATVFVRGLQILSLLFVASLCGCSRGVMREGTPDLNVDGFFVCQKCGCLSAINGGEPPTQIPAHAALCSNHAWRHVSRDEYVGRASQWPLEMVLLPPAYDLTVSTSTGNIGPLIYRSALVFRVGPRYYAIRGQWFGPATFIAGLALAAAAWFCRKAMRKARPEDTPNERQLRSFTDRSPCMPLIDLGR